MPVTVFTNFTEKDKNNAVERLISGGTPSQDFFLMVILSILTATFGLLLNSSAIIIGIAEFNWELVSGSFLLFVVNTIGVVFASMITFSLMNFYGQRR